MNGKASVSKELNAKHSKILGALLKQPDNKECADCRSKAPRWASVNLGIFHMYAMLWYPSQPWCPHLTGKVYNTGYMASRSGCFYAMSRIRRGCR